MSEAPDDRDELEEPKAPEKSAGAQMTIAAIIISAFGLLGKVLGYGKEILIANWWGRGAAVDAFVVVYKFIVFQVYTKIEKLLRPTFLPIFVEHRSEGQERQAWHFFRVIGTITFVVMTVISLAAIIWAPWIVRTFWPALELAAIGADLLRISGGALLLLVMSVMVELTLHSHKEFTIPAMADAGRQFVLFGCIAGLIGLGVYAAGEPSGMKAAAIGVLLGGATRLLIQLPALIRRSPDLRPAAPERDEAVPVLIIIFFWWFILLADAVRHAGRRIGVISEATADDARLIDRIADYGKGSTSDVVKMFSLIPPVIVGLLFSMLRGYFDSRFGTDAGEGVVAALNYGRMLADLPTLILPFAVSLAVYPFVSEWAARKDRQALADSLVSMTRAMVFIFLPVAIAMIVLANPIIATAFERGEFTAQDTSAVERALVPYSAGLPFFAVEASINNWYFALADTATPNYIGAIMAVLHILIAGFGVYALSGSIGVIAAALSISKALKVIILYAMLRKRIGEIDRGAVMSFASRMLIATAAMIAVVFAVQGGLAPILMVGGTIHRLIFLAVVGVSGVIVYFAAAALLRIEEVGMVIDYARKKINKKLGGK
ncbi:MAG: murein biosynthesis integral membrane protein MurJ [Armatimonadota bacterium]